MKTTEILGKNLTELRLNKGYTQAEVGEIIGIAQTTYAGYETGRNEPSLDILIRFAELYNTSLDYLAGRYQSGTAVKDILVNDHYEENKNYNFPDEISHTGIASIKLKDGEDSSNVDTIITEDNIVHIVKPRGKYNRVKKNKPRTKKAAE